MTMADLYEYSTPEIVRLMGTRFKNYRMRCGLTQKDVSEQSADGRQSYSISFLYLKRFGSSSPRRRFLFSSYSE